MPCSRVFGIVPMVIKRFAGPRRVQNITNAVPLMFTVLQKQRPHLLSTKPLRGLCSETLNKSQGKTFNWPNIRRMIF